MTTNAEHQRRHYYRHKHQGCVYLVKVGDQSYVGSTTNSLPKRLAQHRAKGTAIGRLMKERPELIDAKILEYAKVPEELDLLEDEWINRLQPTLNERKVNFLLAEDSNENTQ